jgi:hypothetical protein
LFRPVNEAVMPAAFRQFEAELRVIGAFDILEPRHIRAEKIEHSNERRKIGGRHCVIECDVVHYLASPAISYRMPGTKKSGHAGLCSPVWPLVKEPPVE